MSNGWGWFVFLATTLSMLACFWLIVFANRQRKSPEAIAESESHVWDEDVRELNNPLPMWWLWLFVLTLLFGFAYLAYYPGLVIFNGVADWSQESQYQREVAKAEAKYAPIFAEFGAMPVSDLVNNERALGIGKSLFANYCAQCHGSTAQGAPGFPNLTDDEWMWGDSPQQIEQTIMNGRNGIMPMLAPALGGEEGVNEMVAYVQGLADGQEQSSPAHAKYMTLCIACHGPEGKGNPALGAPNLANDTWLYGSSDAAIRKTLTEGRNGVMPAHSKLLGPDRIRLLAAYVYSLSH
jgi:cytochrome c oxidase cbb3-type subunit III